MQSSGTTTSRALKMLMNSSGRATAASAAVLVLRSFLPLAAVLLIRFYVDRLTGSTDAGPVSAPGAVTLLIVAMALTLLAEIGRAHV